MPTMPYALRGMASKSDGFATMLYALRQCVIAMTLARRAYGIVESNFDENMFSFLVEDMEMLDAVVESIIWEFS